MSTFRSKDISAIRSALFSKASLEVIQLVSADIHTYVWNNGEAGQNKKKVLLLHGFPETPEIFFLMVEELVARDYAVYAPFLPGYASAPRMKQSQDIPHLIDLAQCIAELAQHISPQPRSLALVGHDWGAVIAYASAAYCPQRFSALLTMAVPPLPAFLKSLITLPAQWGRSAYMLFFQLRFNIPERLLIRREAKKLRALCLRWCGGAPFSAAYFSQPDVFAPLIGKLKKPLDYYRGLMPLLSGDWRAWRRSMALAYQRIDVPTQVLVGERDGCIPPPVYQGIDDYFRRGVQCDIIPGAGHFLPLDAPVRAVEALEGLLNG